MAKADDDDGRWLDFQKEESDRVRRKERLSIE